MQLMHSNTPLDSLEIMRAQQRMGRNEDNFRIAEFKTNYPHIERNHRYRLAPNQGQSIRVGDFLIAKRTLVPANPNFIELPPAGDFGTPADFVAGLVGPGYFDNVRFPAVDILPIFDNDEDVVYEGVAKDFVPGSVANLLTAANYESFLLQPVTLFQLPYGTVGYRGRTQYVNLANIVAGNKFEVDRIDPFTGSVWFKLIQ